MYSVTTKILIMIMKILIVVKTKIRCHKINNFKEFDDKAILRKSMKKEASEHQSIRGSNISEKDANENTA
jgi:hypothetical protein